MVKIRSDGTRPIDVTLTYDVPVLEHRLLGGTLRDFFDQNPNTTTPPTPCANNACAGLPQQIWRTEPVESGGKAVMRSVTERLHDRPKSALLHGLGYGAAGAAVGGAFGWIVGGFLGAPALGAALGATVLGGGVGLSSAAAVAGDRVRLEWEARPIVTERLGGYRETVTAGTLHGRPGFYHRFQPDLQMQVLGTYQVPRIVHYEEPR